MLKQRGNRQIQAYTRNLEYVLKRIHFNLIIRLKKELRQRNEVTKYTKERRRQ
jgi:hypothetical protein